MWSRAWSPAWSARRPCGHPRGHYVAQYAAWKSRARSGRSDTYFGPPTAEQRDGYVHWATTDGSPPRIFVRHPARTDHLTPTRAPHPGWARPEHLTLAGPGASTSPWLGPARAPHPGWAPTGHLT